VSLLSRLWNPLENRRRVTGHRDTKCALRPNVLTVSRKGTVRTDMYAELYLWNGNVDSLIRVLQRLEALNLASGPTLRGYGIRLEELRSIVNVTILERMLMREQTDYWRLIRQRDALDNANRNEVV